MEKPKRSLRNCPAEPTTGDGSRPLPGQCWAALQAIFHHLKQQARSDESRQSDGPGPGVSGATSPGFRAGLPGPEPADDRFDTEQFSRALSRALHSQFAAVHRRIRTAQWLVLINDWPEVEHLWGRLASELRTPLLELSFLARSAA